MKKVVTIGGGSGSYSLLRGLKQYPYDITAITTSFDSGGSSGVLRDEYGILPPGDARRCLVALSDGWREETLRQLFAYRFKEDSSLGGHNFGNLLLTALSDILGSDETAIEKAGELLNIRGTVLPVSLTRSNLVAELEDGTVVEGESNIDIPEHDGSLRIDKISLSPSASLYEKAADAIEDADIIIFGPGDLYTSVIANLVVDGFKEALQKSNAKTVYMVNLFTKWGETHDYKASEFAKETLRYAGIEKFDYIIYNAQKVSRETVAKYAKENKAPVVVDDELKKYAKKLISGFLVGEGDVLRHDSNKVAEVLKRVIN